MQNAIENVGKIMREQNTASQQELRAALEGDEQRAIQEKNTTSRRAAREAMPEVDRQAIQEQDTAAHQVARNAMTEEEHERHKEAERFRRRSCQYQKGLSYYEDFEPSIIPGGRHYFSRYTNDTQEHERVCSRCNAWKFPNK
ncbi:Helitron helicase [Phytophthora megakarya]|uniref:Helitron helicase n=1 Tax=Phytophthora megakarya TaxID=4795 RepID=A0A225UDR4_9STRA|nr:Helitron helicase [Phytophthora megakarya]